MNQPNTRIPGPRYWEALDVVRRFRSAPLDALDSLVGRYGDIIRFRLGPKSVVLVNDAELVEHILQKNWRNYHRQTYLNSFATRLLGEFSLIANDGPAWSDARRVLFPLFRNDRLKTFLPLMFRETQAAIQGMDASVSRGETIPVSDVLSQLSLEIASLAFLGEGLSAEQQETIHQEFALLSRNLTERLTSWVPLPPVLPLPRDVDWRRSLRRLNDTMTDIARERRGAVDSGSVGEDLLSLMVAVRDEETGEGFSDEQIRDHVKTFMVGGFETTAAALEWALYRLAHEPEVAARIREEADLELSESKLAAVQSGERPLHLPYTTAVFEETMRLHPPGWLTARKNSGVDILGDYQLEPGTDVLISPYTMHRNPRYWADPLKFRPERFLGDEAQQRPRFAYLPFGGGPQACIGRGFGMQEGKLVLALFIQSFYPELPPRSHIEPEALLTLRIAGGLTVRLRRWEQENSTANAPRQ